jgi:hypothetical protein
VERGATGIMTGGGYHCAIRNNLRLYFWTLAKFRLRVWALSVGELLISAPDTATLQAINCFNHPSNQYTQGCICDEVAIISGGPQAAVMYVHTEAPHGHHAVDPEALHAGESGAPVVTAGTAIDICCGSCTVSLLLPDKHLHQEFDLSRLHTVATAKLSSTVPRLLG